MENPFNKVENYCKTLGPWEIKQRDACDDLKMIKTWCRHINWYHISVHKAIRGDIKNLNIPLEKSKRKFANQLFDYCTNYIL